MLKYHLLVMHGEMAERFKALVLKTSDVERHRGFESLSLRQLCLSRIAGDNHISPVARVRSLNRRHTARSRKKQVEDLQMYPSGSRGSPAKGVDWDNRCESSNLSICANEKP